MLVTYLQKIRKRLISKMICSKSRKDDSKFISHKSDRPKPQYVRNTHARKTVNLNSLVFRDRLDRLGKAPADGRVKACAMPPVYGKFS